MAAKNGDHSAETKAEYLEEAKRCELIAARSNDPKDKNSWLELAERWRALAVKITMGR